MSRFQLLIIFFRCAVPVSLLLWLIFFLWLLLLTLPIGQSPVKFLLPGYRSWHAVTVVHLARILLTPAPPDVQPLMLCQHVRCTDSKSSIDMSNVEFYQEARARFRNVTSSRQEIAFQPIMSTETKANLLYTFHVLSQALQAAGIEYAVLHGTLLGIYRFGGIQPWDDDIDIGINVSKWQQVRLALSCIQGFDLYVDPLMRWSFFLSTANVSEAMPDKKYPFVDIFFYAEDSTHVWGLHWNNRHHSVFLKSDMFPYRPAVMDSLSVFVPRKMKAVLFRQYGDLDVCSTQEYSHFHLSERAEITTLPCSRLLPLYGKFGTKFSVNS